MKREYVINNNPEHNPGCHHEMHTTDHADELRIKDYSILGTFENECDALIEGKKRYADGCRICCPKANHD